jgi:DNA-binding MarR family transcriptional regulator
MQVHSETDAAAQFDRIVAREVPGTRGLQAWNALLRAHATLLRQLETDLEGKAGLALADYDVLAQLAGAGGSLRMTELADRALISRSGMTRRVARLVHEGLVRRAHADADARGVVVLLTDSGLRRLTVAAPVHLRGVSDLFVANLDDQELAVLESALTRVTIDCTPGPARRAAGRRPAERPARRIEFGVLAQP